MFATGPGFWKESSHSVALHARDVARPLLCLQHYYVYNIIGARLCRHRDSWAGPLRATSLPQPP